MGTNADIKAQIAGRNLVRAEVSLPALDERELAKLSAARDQRIFEAAFASERARFSNNWASRAGWLSRYGEWNKARRQVREELRMGQHIEHLLHELGYKLAEDAWEDHGRKTYVNSEDADREFLKDIETTLLPYDWTKDKHRLRRFRCATTGEFLEVEPGGAETSGHFLHHLKPDAEWD
jgi:hypothetical protein